MSKRCVKKTAGSGAAAAKKARTPSKQNEAQEDDESVLHFSMEVDQLERRICFMPFDAEIYMASSAIFH